MIEVHLHVIEHVKSETLGQRIMRTDQSCAVGRSLEDLASKDAALMRLVSENFALHRIPDPRDTSYHLLPLQLLSFGVSERTEGNPGLRLFVPCEFEISTTSRC